jgi:NADH dehydrogenase FAD-containing subunit
VGEHAALERLRAASCAKRVLEARGMEVRLGTRVAAVTASGVKLSNGEAVRADTVVWVAGVTVNNMLASALRGELAEGRTGSATGSYFAAQWAGWCGSASTSFT